MVQLALVTCVANASACLALGQLSGSASTESVIASAKRPQRGVVHLVYEQTDAPPGRGRRPAQVLAGCDTSSGAWYFVTLASAHLRTAQREHFEGAGLMQGPAMVLCKDQAAFQAMHDHGPIDAIQWLELSLMEARRSALSLESFNTDRGWIFRWVALGGDPKLLAEYCPKEPPPSKERLIRLDPNGVLDGVSEWGSEEIVDRRWRRLPQTGIVVNEQYRAAMMKLVHVEESVSGASDEFTVQGLRRRIDRARVARAEADAKAVASEEASGRGRTPKSSHRDADTQESVASSINWTLFGTGVLVAVVGGIAYVRRR